MSSSIKMNNLEDRKLQELSEENLSSPGGRLRRFRDAGRRFRLRQQRDSDSQTENKQDTNVSSRELSRQGIQSSVKYLCQLRPKSQGSHRENLLRSGDQMVQQPNID